MTTAPSQDRLRQIAILISSVDAVAARQILLHLPTDAARQVRALANGLGAVSADERRKILAEFQRSANSSAATSPRPSTPASSHSRTDSSSSNGMAAGTRLGESSDYRDDYERGFAAGTRLGESSDYRGDANDQQGPSSAPWTRLSTAALVRFVRDERNAVTAVVISQLSPAVAVEVLQNLPAAISHDVLLRLSRLQDIDPEAMQAIDEHLSQRLQQYQHHMQSEQENVRRITSLLAAAPPATRQQWSQLLTDALPPAEAVGQSTAAETAQHFPSSPLNSQANQPDHASQPSYAHPVSKVELASDDSDAADILPFPHPAQQKQMSPVDRSLIQLEFEQILTLPPTLLAHLLSSTESQTVLLALAGATPEFMKRFYRLLDRRDARALQSRLQQIGAIQLRDVDEAQWRIVENAASLRTARFTTIQASATPARAA